jgi:hypothetical protein
MSGTQELLQVFPIVATDRSSFALALTIFFRYRNKRVCEGWVATEKMRSVIMGIFRVCVGQGYSLHTPLPVQYLGRFQSFIVCNASCNFTVTVHYYIIN